MRIQLGVGWSQISAASGCFAVARRIPPKEHAVIVTVLPDSAAKYLNERFWDEDEA